MEHHQITAELDTAAVSPRRGAVVRQILNALDTARSAGEVARIVGKPTCYVTGNLNRLLREGYVSRISRGTYIAVAGTGNPESNGPKPDKHRLNPEIGSYRPAERRPLRLPRAGRKNGVHGSTASDLCDTEGEGSGLSGDRTDPL